MKITDSIHIRNRKPTLIIMKNYWPLNLECRHKYSLKKKHTHTSTNSNSLTQTHMLLDNTVDTETVRRVDRVLCVYVCT